MKTKELNSEGRVTFFGVDSEVLSRIPLYEQMVQAGFPSPAYDFLDLDINLTTN